MTYAIEKLTELMIKQDIKDREKGQKEVIALAIDQFLKNKDEILKQIKKLQQLLEE